jgi:hypothetical protein
MAFDLMDMIKGAVAKKVMGQFSGLLGGVDEKQSSSVFDNVTGSILGGMMKKAQTDDGARDVFDMVKKQDGGILDKLGDLMGGGDEGNQQIMKQGGGMLDGLLGGSSQQSSMFGSIAKALGLDEGMVGKLMMMAAPFIIGAIGKHIKSKAMDMAGFKNMLGSQGPSIAKSLSPGLADNLGFGNLLSNVPSASAPAPTSAPVKAAAPAGGGDLMKYIIPLLLLVGLIAAAVFVIPKLMEGGGEKTIINAANVEQMEKDVRSKLETLAKEVEGIKSTEDAEGIKVKIDEFKTYVSGLRFDGVSAEEMQSLKGQLDMRLMKGPLENFAYKVDGVKDILDASVKALSNTIIEVQKMEK